MKLILKITILLFTLNIVAQQNYINGTITDKNQTPLTGVNIYIKSSKTGVQSDFDGNFKILKKPTTNINLTISYIGYKTKEITVSGDKNINLGTIVLLEGNELLQEIVVQSRKNSFSRKKTAYVSKLPLKDIENPQVYSTITTELLESQIITNFDDAINNATGISKLWESTGRAPGEGTGYFSTRGFATQPSLVDGVPGFTFSAIDPSYIERIEVVKGPSATLFGSTVTSLGGLINVVTKKPYKGFGGSVSYTAGSFGMNRISADINTPLGTNDDLFFRLNTSYLTQDSWQDAGFRKTFFVAPSLTYRANNSLNLSFGIEYSDTEQTNPSMLFVRRGLPMVSRNVKDLGINPNKSFTSNDITLSSPIFNTRAIADYKISDQWNSQTIFASSYSEANGYYQYMIEGAGAAFLVLQPLAAVPGVNDILLESQSLLQRDAFTRIYDKRDANATKFNIQQNFTGDFKLGDVRNRLIIGLDYVNRNSKTNNQSGNPTLAATPTFSGILQTLTYLEAINHVPVNTALGLQAQLSGFPYFDGMFAADGTIIPNNFTPNTKHSVKKTDLDAVFNQVPTREIETGSSTFAVYASDVINISKKLTVNLGLRLDYFNQKGNKNNDLDNYTKTTLSPNAGVLYQPFLNKLSVFANYQTGFVNNNPVVNQDGTVDTFKPTKATQFEGGFKTNFFNGKLNAGISYYHITVNDALNSDPNGILFPTSIDIEETVSKGLEFEINTNPFDGLNLRASFSHNDSKITKAYSNKTKTAYAALQDRRPEEAGPKNIYNFWADYKFLEGTFLEKFGVGAGFNGASKHLMMNNGVSGEFTLPSYTIYNASVYYNANKFKVGFKVNNLTDETYYKGWSTINAQAPRAFLGTIQYKF